MLDNPPNWASQLCLSFLIAFFFGFIDFVAAEERLSSKELFRGPVDLAISADETWGVSANELSGSVSLIDLKALRVIDELQVGGHPTAVVRTGPNRIAVSCRDSGEVVLAQVDQGQVAVVGRVPVGFHPHGLAFTNVASEAGKLFVSLNATGEIAEIDLGTARVMRKFTVGAWPRYLAISPDGRRLAVGLGGESAIAVLDVASGEELYREPLSGGINLGQMQCSSDGQYVYFPWMIYRSNPINPRNIRRGWILASRAARVRLDGPADREAISLDPPGLAVADPFGVAITPNEKRLAVSSSGTHELLVYRLQDLPFVGAGGPGDLIDERLMRDNDLFYRIETGGRPMAVRALSDNRRMLIANHTLDTIQVVDLEAKKVSKEILLGARPSETPEHLGMQIFYDGRRSLDQWYSCHSCHLDGGGNAKPMDTWNDGSALTVKTVLPMFAIGETAPWTWHGWQADLDESIQNSFTETMQGQPAGRDDVAAVRAYITSLRLPPNPFLTASGKLTESAERGRKIFESERAACASCHSGATYSDGLNHDVGLGSESDKYPEYNTPSLLGAYAKVRYLHDGRAKTLEAVLTKYHGPELVSGTAALSDEEVQDLVAYLKSL